MAHHPLADLEHVLLGHEAHLQVDLGELGLAVAARVLVAVAARDLEVALEAAHHQELLVELRRLGQGVELARLDARGHEEIPRALGRGADESRRLDLVKAPADEVFPGRERHLVAQPDAVLHGARAQVEVAVAQARVLLRLALAVDHEGQGLAGREDLEVEHLHLEVAGLHVRVSHVPGPGADRAPDRDAILEFERRRALPQRGRRVRFHHRLHDPRTVAQVYKRDAAVIAKPVHPAVQDDVVFGL